MIRSVGEAFAAPDEHRLISIGCELGDGRPTIGADIDGYTGSEHWRREIAEAAALGEALERYSGSFVPNEQLVVSTAEDLPTAVAPHRFSLFSDEQYRTAHFPFRRFRRDTLVAWAEGFRLPDGVIAHLPAQLVYLPWRGRAAAEARIGYATSSGLACAGTLEEAVLVGLLELVERDAFMLVWRNRLSLPLLEWSGDPTLTRIDRRYFAPTGLSYAAVDLSAFLDVPTVLGVVHGPPGVLGALGVGAASAPTVGVAWRKALAEAFSVQRWVRDRALERPDDLDVPAAEIRTFDAHTLHYAHPGQAQRAAFLDASEARREVGDIPPLEGGNVRERIEAICRRLDERGLSAYAADVTSPDVRSGGLCVAHAVAPELCPLDVVEGARFLGGARLYSAAYDAGLISKPLEPDDLNSDPHPFP